MRWRSFRVLATQIKIPIAAGKDVTVTDLPREQGLMLVASGK
jgi:hypothetical protein